MQEEGAMDHDYFASQIPQQISHNQHKKFQHFPNNFKSNFSTRDTKHMASKSAKLLPINVINPIQSVPS
jgi:hypothetical protein